MNDLNQARAPQRTTGTRRNRSRQQGGPAWVRPFTRARRALDASMRLIGSTMRTVARSERCAHRRPVRTSRRLQEASVLLLDASARLQRAAQQLAASNECLRNEPEQLAVAPELLVLAAAHWVEVAECLQVTASDIFSLQEDVLLGLRTGSLVPERPAGRPRIIIAPRPNAIRAFLLLRQPRVVDRIAPILRRRRRTPRPAAVRVPRRNLLGRAPPLVSISLL